MQNISIESTKELLKSIEGKIVAIVGDIMLDRYFWGNVSRISPEAPVPVIDIENETFHLGGAANVANNLKSLGISPLLCGVIGNDNSGKTFLEIAEGNGINTIGLFNDPMRPTTVKTRIIGNNQHIARLDREVRSDISHACESYIMNVIYAEPELSAIIFEDYNKGVLTSPLITEIIAFGRDRGIPVFADPKIDNFFAFKRVDVFKPNRKEAGQALGVPMKSADDVIAAGKALLEKLECKNVLLTLGAEGMMLFESNGEVFHVPTRARRVADVSGAGDTVIAALTAFVAGGATIKEAASLANYAAGAVCEQPGIVSITKETLLNSINARK